LHWLVVLEALHPSVDPVEVQQILVRAFFCYNTILDDDDLVGVTQGAQPMAMVMTVRPAISRSRPSATDARKG
jgi:hypothetical protein